jgi:hypothetical protein
VTAEIENLESRPLVEDNSEIARRFRKLDCQAFERLGRYETALWRQVYQVIFVLDVLRRQNLGRCWLPRPSSNTRFRPFGSLLTKAWDHCAGKITS